MTAGWHVYGVTDDGRYALVVVGDRAYVGNWIPPKDPASPLLLESSAEVRGLRWECSATHLGYYPDVYRKRFPCTTCKVCDRAIRYEAEPAWTGWLDADGDELSYVPTLHDHEPEVPAMP